MIIQFQSDGSSGSIEVSEPSWAAVIKHLSELSFDLPLKDCCAVIRTDDTLSIEFSGDSQLVLLLAPAEGAQEVLFERVEQWAASLSPSWAKLREKERAKSAKTTREVGPASKTAKASTAPSEPTEPSDYSAKRSVVLVDEAKLVGKKPGSWAHFRRPAASQVDKVSFFDGDEKRQLCIELLQAVKRGEASLVRSLLSSGADASFNSSAALRWSIYNGEAELASLLLKAGARASDLPWSSLPSSAEADSPKPSSAEINSEPGGGGDSMHIALMSGRLDLVALLVESGINIYASERHYLTTALLAGGEAAVRYLLSSGLGPHGGEGRGALAAAAASGQLNMAKILIESGADPNETSEHRSRPLESAAAKGDFSMVKLLLSAGADRSRDNYLAAVVAELSGHDELAYFLRGTGGPVKQS